LFTKILISGIFNTDIYRVCKNRGETSIGNRQLAIAQGQTKVISGNVCGGVKRETADVDGQWPIRAMCLR
jgi:hypothetical protein